MTEQEVREKIDNGFDEVKPIVEKMTHLIMDAYEKGITVGMELGKNFTVKEG